METLKIPEKVVFWAIEHPFFFWKIRKEQTDVYFLVEFWKGVHLRAAIKTALDSLFVESFKPQRIPLVWLCRRLYYSSPVKPPLQPPNKIRVSKGVYYGGEHD